MREINVSGSTTRSAVGEEVVGGTAILLSMVISCSGGGRLTYDGAVCLPLANTTNRRHRSHRVNSVKTPPIFNPMGKAAAAEREFKPHLRGGGSYSMPRPAFGRT